MILKAAVLQKDSLIVYTGKRHNDVFISMRNQGVSYKYCIQGFVDDKGNFFDRFQAYNEAKRCSQIITNKGKGILSNLKKLCSEDLY